MSADVASELRAAVGKCEARRVARDPAFPDDVTPVLRAVVEKAARVCEAVSFAANEFDGVFIHLKTPHGLSAPAVDAMNRVYRRKLGRGLTVARSIVPAPSNGCLILQSKTDYSPDSSAL